jgi:putative ABC transport system permease protein
MTCGTSLLTDMIYNYFKIAVRSLLKFKAYASINLFGLAIGLMTGILILVYVLDELSYDQFHEKKDRVYRVETTFFNTSTGDKGPNESNGWAIGTKMRAMPEVESVVYSRSASFLLINHEGKRIREQMHFASPEFFDIFSFKLLQGNPAKALTEPFSIVITEKLAKKYFPTTDAFGKTLVVADTMQLVVTGVMADIPSNSHIQLDALISFSTYTSVINPGFDYNGGWGNINVRNYVLVRPSINIDAFRKKVYGIYMDNEGEQLKHWGVEAYVHLNPLSRLYLHTKSLNGLGPLGSIDRIYMVSGIAFFVILLACINFINLTTARSVYRAKEVGLRKVVGSTRQALIRQFLSESFVLTLLSLLLGLTFAGLALPLFNQILGKTYAVESIFSAPVVAGILVLLIVITILSGYYPALVMSSMRPTEVLKGKLHSSTRGAGLRKGLVVFQFMISTGLVLGTLIVIEQLDYMQKQELGFAKDQVLVVNAARAKSPNPDGYRTFKNGMRGFAAVEDVTYANALPGRSGWAGQVSYPEGRPAEEGISVEYMAVDEDYVNTLGLTVIAGTGFSEEVKSKWEDGLVLNETAVSMYGWADPKDAIGKRIASPSGYPAGEILGVVKDYHLSGLQQKIGPIAMDYNPQSSYLFAIRYKAANTADIIKRAREVWLKNFPGYDFDYFFLDEEFEKQYQAEKKLATVFGIFSSLTILIAVIGLLGLVSFMVASRTKEIGVRKVLGAGVGQISALLSREFMMLIALANVLVFPVVWYVAGQWLSLFAVKVQLSPLLFVTTFAFALLITLVTISVQTIRAALADPVKSLRYE